MSSFNTSPGAVLRVPSLFTDPLARIFLFIMLFLSLLFGRTEFSVFCLVMLLLSSGAKLWLRFGANRVVSSFRADKVRVTPGEPLVFTAEAENGSILPMTVRSRLAGAGGLSGDGGGEDVRTSRVGGRFKVRLQWSLKAPGRGVYGIGPPITEAGDALGLFYQETLRDEPVEIIVYPDLFPIASFSRMSNEFLGNIRAEGLIEDPVNPMGTREYHSGRPSRAIHWKASARLNRLQEKVFEPTRRERIILSLDVRGFHEAGDEDGFEDILEAAASIAVHLVERGVSVGMITNARLKGPFSSVVPSGQGINQLPAILERMARMTMEPATDLTKLAGHILPRTPGTACLHCIREKDEAADTFASYVLGHKTPMSFMAARRSRGPVTAAAAGIDLILTETLRGIGGAAP